MPAEQLVLIVGDRSGVRSVTTRDQVLFPPLQRSKLAALASLWNRSMPRAAALTPSQLAVHVSLSPDVLTRTVPDLHAGLFGNFAEELGVCSERLQAVDEQLEARCSVAVGSEAAENTAQLPHHLELLAIEQQLLMAR